MAHRTIAEEAARSATRLANLLAKSYHNVTKEYYINDAGGQVTALAWAAYWRRILQAIGTPLTEAAQFS